MKIFNFLCIIFWIIAFSVNSKADEPLMLSVGMSVASVDGEESFNSFGRSEREDTHYAFIVPSIDFECGVSVNFPFPIFLYIGQNVGFFSVNDFNFLNFTSKVGFVPKLFSDIEANPFFEIGFSNLRKGSNDGFRYVPGLFFSTGVFFEFDSFYMRIGYNSQIYKHRHNRTVLNRREAVFRGSGISLAFLKNIKLLHE